VSADKVVNLQNVPEADLDVYTAGKHSIAMTGLPSRGIHVFWAAKADELLESGIMPKNTYNILHKLAKTDDQRDIIPKVSQLANRKKFLF
jgi:hypothetical protein